jgi:hypothetical protein
MADAPHNKADEPDNEFDAKLKEIEAKAKSLRNRGAFPDPPDWNYKRRKRKDDGDDGSNARGLGIGISAAYALVGCMFGGFGVGYLIDRATGGEIAQPIGATIGVMIGVASTFILINRTGK